MVKHSKNRSASAHYSHAERQKLPYGTKRARIGSEAFRRFDQCVLCLMPAREPRSCDSGHIFCHECILSSLLEQKKDLKRQKALVETMRKDEEIERAEALEKARARILADFELAQGSVKRPTGTAPAPVIGQKRKLDESELDRMMKESEEAALEQIQLEQAEARKSKLGNYWLPHNTPTAAATKLEDVKLQLLCKFDKPTHPISLKSLQTVDFAAANEKDADAGSICHACRRSLNNNADVHVMSPCGHALCGTCTTTLAKLGNCPTCDKTVERYIKIAIEGTGYSSKGGVEIKAKDVTLR